jgi:hypothetical protein
VNKRRDDENELTKQSPTCHIAEVRCPKLKDGGPKREYGEDDPKGAETVTAPATVSGEVLSDIHWETGKEA